jgi:2-dehydropantoate 2-reductase
LAIVAVKAWQVEEAANALCGSLAEDGIALPLQNGVDAPDQLADALGNDRAIAGLCGLVSYIEAPGHIAHVSVDPFIQLGERDGSVSSRCQQLAATLSDAKGVEASVPQNMQAALWQKFMFIVALSGVGAVTRAPLGITRSQAETKALLEACVNEAYQVGCASGVQFPHTAVDEVLSLIDKSPADATVSMQRDICEGKPSELFSQNGAVVRMGQALGVATPVNSMITAALTPQEHRARDIVDFDRT